MSLYRTFRSPALLVLAGALACAALGQSTGTGAKTGSNKTPAITRPMPPTPDRLNRVLMLSGNVITADGSPLPEPAAIERVCNGRVTREGRTDFKGYFSIDIGRVFSPIADAEGTAETSGSGGLSALDTLKPRLSPNPPTLQSVLMGCELRASLAEYRSSSIMLPMSDLSSGVGAVNVGNIVVERMEKAQGATVSATSLNAPKDARKAYEKGHHAIANRKLPEAQQALEKAVNIYPRYASAWVDLGWVYTQQNQLDSARNAFQQAQNADDKFVPAYVGLSSVALRESKWQQAADFSSRATQLDGVGFPAAFYYNSLANYRLGNREQAEKSAHKAEMLGANRTFPQLNLLLGALLANRHDYADAADHLRSYLKLAPTAPNAEQVRQQLAEMEKLEANQSRAGAAPPVK